MKWRQSRGLFPADAIIMEVASEPAVMLGAGRALILQVAHPAVAAGVDEFSNFQTNPFSRLIGTLEATYSVVFGSAEVATGVGQRIEWIHERIVGATYRANDPENLLWVHATLFDTMRLFFTTLVRPLTGDEEEELYQQMARVAELFGLPRANQPLSCAAFDEYFAHTIVEMAIGDTARQLAHDIAWPELNVLPKVVRTTLRPVIGSLRRWAIGTTPLAVRDQLQLEWSERDEQRLLRACRRTKSVFRYTPRPVRIAPGWLQGRYLLYRAQQHVDEFVARQGVN